jgi:hypothetical protein
MIERLFVTEAELQTILDDSTKVISGDLQWLEDEDHSPAVEFRAEISSSAGYPLFVRGSYNAAIPAVTYAIIHRGVGRIYALDLGKEHHNPSCQNVGERHKHQWTETFADKEAYLPEDIKAPASAPVAVWDEFCAEARIDHHGTLHEPPLLQLDLL